MQIEDAVVGLQTLSVSVDNLASDPCKYVAVAEETGDATLHDGFTPHFSQGNTTDSNRRALILNFRPKLMIDLERSMGINHQGERKVRNK